MAFSVGFIETYDPTGSPYTWQAPSLATHGFYIIDFAVQTYADPIVTGKQIN